MHTEASRPVEPIEKKVYVVPQVEKAQKLEAVTQGETPVVTGALPT